MQDMSNNSPTRAGAFGETGEAGEFEMRELLAEAVRRVDRSNPALAEEMSDLLASSIDELRGDRQLIEMLLASVESNLSTIFHILANDIGFESLQPPTAAIEYAVRLAQRDIPLSGLTRAYYLGQSMLLRLVLEEVSRLELPEGAKLQTVRGVADMVHGYIDWMLQRLSEAYTVEHRRWWSARATVNTAIILKVLRGENVSPRSFETETHYRLEQRHLAMVAWVEDSVAGAEVQQRIEQLVRRVAAALGSQHAPLVSAVDPSTVWSWVAMTMARIDRQQREELDRLVAGSDGIRLALGEVDAGAAGFRRSHEQAMGARRVALASRGHRSKPVVADSDKSVALTSILLKDHQASLTWMRKVLGEFAGDGEASRAMRETLRCFYASGENYSRTAEMLGVHRNTVRHRIERFEASRAAADGLDPLEVALALRVHDTLGE